MPAPLVASDLAPKPFQQESRSRKGRACSLLACTCVGCVFAARPVDRKHLQQIFAKAIRGGSQVLRHSETLAGLRNRASLGLTHEHVQLEATVSLPHPQVFSSQRMSAKHCQCPAQAACAQEALSSYASRSALSLPSSHITQGLKQLNLANPAMHLLPGSHDHVVRQLVA